MNAIDKIKSSVDLLDHVRKRLGQNWKANQWKVFFKAHKDDNDASLCVWEDQGKWYKDFSDHLWAGTIIDFEMNFSKLELWESVKLLCEMYWIQEEKKEFKKSPKRADLVLNFEDYKMSWNNAWFSRWLQTRWLDYDKIQLYKDRINLLAKEFWFCENIWVSEKTYKDVIIFPCYKELENEEFKLVWAKLRRTDGEKFTFKWSALKSVSVWKPKDYKWSCEFSTWLIYDKIDDDYVIIVEWEADYAILKILWFDSVIWNEWGVSSNADEIQKRVKKTKTVISFYDNDPAWIKANRALVEKIWRPIKRIVYPEIDWKDKFDVNDLFNMGYNKEDFQKLLDWAEILDLETAKKEVEQSKPKLYKDRFFYDNTKLEYFDIKDFSLISGFTLARHLFLKPKELEESRMWGVIPTYEGICYLDGWKEGYYNLLDKSKMIHASDNPEIHPDIKDLIYNLCNNNEENARWLLRTIAHKMTHLNDFLVPAVVFHGVWWAWKWLLMKLLAQIFWNNNVQTWLTQEHIDSQFSTYSGQKLVVEFKELSVDNTAKGKKNMNKLKTFIMEDKIMVRRMRQDAIAVDNIAWFIMSSNESKPIQLDSVDSGNRRFTIIKTWQAVWLDKGWKIAKTINDPKNISNFMAWLLQEFPDIKENKNILPLENEDKRDLEFLSESVWNLFFKWLEEKYPDINKLTNFERDYLVDMYRTDIKEDQFNDNRYMIQYFNANLSMRYKVTNIKIRGKTQRWYKIDKKVNWSGCFEDWKFEVPTEPEVKPPF